jgi:hypothetical protein
MEDTLQSASVSERPLDLARIQIGHGRRGSSTSFIAQPAEKSSPKPEAGDRARRVRSGHAGQVRRKFAAKGATLPTARSSSASSDGECMRAILQP